MKTVSELLCMNMMAMLMHIQNFNIIGDVIIGLFSISQIFITRRKALSVAAQLGTNKLSVPEAKI